MKTSKIHITTERLLLQTYTESDAEALHQFVKDNTFFLYNTGPMTLRNNISLDKSRRFLQMLETERQNGKWIWNGIFEKSSRQLIGQLSLYHLDSEDDQCEIGYFITADQMGRGYATEAVGAIVDYCFAELKLHRIMLRIHPENIASIRVAQKLGFVKTGLQLKSFRTFHGEMIDQVVFHRNASTVF